MKVLLVEDHPGLAKVSCDLLREIHGHEVSHAANGRDALAIADEFRPDLILLDLNLPDMHGYRVAELLRTKSQFDRTVLVALTGFGLAGNPEKSRAAGIDAHYRKPMDFDELEQIRRLPGPERSGQEQRPAPGSGR